MSKSKKQPEVIPVHPCLVAYNHPENGLVVMLDNNEFDAPAIWGIVLADIVQPDLKSREGANMGNAATHLSCADNTHSGDLRSHDPAFTSAA